jgi:hypothetical protein
MSKPPMPPFLQSFGGDLLALVAGLLLPRIRRRAWWHSCGQLVGAAVLSLAAAALLVGGTALLADRLLGAARRELAFPNLGPLLAWAGGDHHLPLVAVVALLAALALGALGRGMAGGRPHGGERGSSAQPAGRPNRLVRIRTRGSWNRWNAAEPSRPTLTPESKPPPPRLLRCPSPNPLPSSPSSSGSSEISREFWRWC